MKLLILCAVFAVLSSVEPHGYLQSPLARTSIHRRPNEPYRPPYEYNDSGIECRSPPDSHGSCMQCGTSTDMNRGGAYDKNEITGVYQSGSVSTTLYLYNTLYPMFLDFSIVLGN